MLSHICLNFTMFSSRRVPSHLIKPYASSLPDHAMAPAVGPPESAIQPNVSGLVAAASTMMYFFFSTAQIFARVL